MNDIATSEIEKIFLNMRFGAIAVKKKLVSIDQLNQALKVQETETKAGQPRQYLGDIFKQLFNLSGTDLNYILKIQKELEKTRLYLEKALSQYNSETNTNKRLSKLFGYRFSKNKLSAFIQKTKEGFEEIRVQDLMTWLNSVGITSGICPKKTIENFLNQGAIGMEIQIAQGLAPQKGDALARVIPPKEGTPGCPRILYLKMYHGPHFLRNFLKKHWPWIKKLLNTTYRKQQTLNMVCTGQQSMPPNGTNMNMKPKKKLFLKKLIKKSRIS